MPRMSGEVAPGRAEQQLLAAPRLVALFTAVVVVITACVFAAVADHAMLIRIQRLDDAWLQLMTSGRSPPLTATAKLFNLLGLVYVTLPVRIAVTGLLALRRRWWHLAAFAAAVVISEVLIGLLKGIYGRARPPGSLVATSGASFPSGHSVAASVTVVAAVIALVPLGRRRVWWSTAAVAFSILMALSRAYLGAHWLSDASAGILLGTSCALVAGLGADEVQRRSQGRRPRRPTGAQGPGPGAGRHAGAIGREGNRPTRVAKRVFQRPKKEQGRRSRHEAARSQKKILDARAERSESPVAFTTTHVLGLATALAEFARVLRPGGHLVISGCRSRWEVTGVDELSGSAHACGGAVARGSMVLAIGPAWAAFSPNSKVTGWR